jgi:hypothetical protein
VTWRSIERPGYFGRRRDQIMLGYDAKYGAGNWRLAWVMPGFLKTSTCAMPTNTPGVLCGAPATHTCSSAGDTCNAHKSSCYTRIQRSLDIALEFEQACKVFYEESYQRYLEDRPDDIDFICEFTECYDNSPTNVQSGLDYTTQEASSTHIQDIAVRNVLHRLGRSFTGKRTELLIIRSADSNGYRFGPGNVPFYAPNAITPPSRCPSWAKEGSVEAFWQSNKWLQVIEPGEIVT